MILPTCRRIVIPPICSVLQQSAFVIKGSGQNSFIRPEFTKRLLYDNKALSEIKRLFKILISSFVLRQNKAFEYILSGFSIKKIVEKYSK